MGTLKVAGGPDSTAAKLMSEAGRLKAEADIAAEAKEREERTETYRVLKRYLLDPQDMDKLATWVEQPALAITATYPYMNATRLGEAYGEGDYITIALDGYNRAETFSVVADKVYREAEKDDAAA